MPNDGVSKSKALFKREKELGRPSARQFVFIEIESVEIEWIAP